MPNVFITNTCNLRCGYCFAKGMLGATRHEEMTIEEIKKIADFIEESDASPNGIRPKVISILGGEPTLHSGFTEIVDYLVQKNFIIKLFSNGTFSRKTADYLGKLPAEVINIILNINKEESYTPSQYKNVKNNLKYLNHIISLGFTIYQVDFDYDTVLEYINQYNLKRDIRLGISMPIVGASNAFLKYAEYKQVAKRILEFSDASFQDNISLGLDCGFILCMFNRKELGYLKLRNVHLNFTCDGAIDIGNNGRVWRCFPLYSIHNAEFSRFASVSAIKDYYNDLLPIKTKGISGSCGECRHYLHHNCSGGCYGYEFR